jgi:hypothetical protein
MKRRESEEGKNSVKRIENSDDGVNKIGIKKKRKETQ